MSVRQVFWLMPMLLLVVLAACAAPPPMRHPEMQRQAEGFRPLTTVPQRPQVHVPLQDRAALQRELADNNAAAQTARAAAGMQEPTLPTAAPAVPAELPSDE